MFYGVCIFRLIQKLSCFGAVSPESLESSGCHSPALETTQIPTLSFLPYFTMFCFALLSCCLFSLILTYFTLESPYQVHTKNMLFLEPRSLIFCLPPPTLPSLDIYARGYFRTGGDCLTYLCILHILQCPASARCMYSPQ